MNSYAWMNQQHQQVGPPSLSPQAATHLTHGTMNNQQVGTAKNLYIGVQPQKNASSFTFQDAAHRGMSNWQTSAVPDGKVSSQQLSTQKNNSYLLNFLIGNLQNSSTNMQTKNPCLLGTNECQRTTQHNFHQNSLNQRPPNMIKANTAYPQQAQSAHWSQQVTHCPPSAVITQDGKVSDFQHYRVQKNPYAHRNRKSMKPISAYAQTAASLVREQAVCTSTLVSATSHNKQIAYSSTNRQNSIQQGFSPVPPPSMEGWNSFRNQNFAATSSSNGHTLDLSSTSQKTQYPTHLNTIPYTGATSSGYSNPFSCQYQTTHFLAKTNEHPLNPATAGSQNKGMVESVQTMHNAGSNGGLVHKSTSTTAMHVQMTQPNTNMQPLTLTENYNSNASSQLPPYPGHYLPKTTQSIILRAQHLTNAPPQQSSAPSAFSVIATGDGSENGSKADNPFSEGNLVESSSDISPLMQLHKCISPQAKETQSSVPIKQNDSSIYSSPGCTGTRAVAVVQPLSQESYQIARKCTYSNTINQSDECTAAEELPFYAEKLSVLPADKNSNSAASTDHGNVSSSDSPGLQKRLSSDERGSATVLTTQQSITSEVPASQNGDMDRSEMPVELSSFPTTPWTIEQLTRLILEEEKGQKDFPVVNSASMLIRTFWHGNCKALVYKLKTGWYKDLITSVNEFCGKHVTSDSIILSQVKPQFQKKLKNCHVLKDEVISEPLYKSSWLNINEKVDDIDKEFGFPWFLKHSLYMLKIGSQQYQDSTVESNAAHIVSEVPDKVLPRGELEPLDSGEEKQASTVKTVPTQSSSPNKSESIDSNNTDYSFDLKVLSPEEAKAIFEHVQSMNMDNQLEKTKSSSMHGELHEVVLLSDSKPEESFSAIEQVCCLAKWIEIITGSNTSSLGKCQCKKKQSHNGSTDEILDKEEAATQNNKLGAITSDSKLHFTPKGGNLVDGRKNIDYQIPTISLLGLHNELNQTTDLTKDDETPHLFFDREPKNISQESINNNQSSIILLSQEDNSSNENKISNPEECVQDHLKSAGSSQSSSKNDSKNKIRKVVPVTNPRSDPEDDCAQVQQTSTDVAASSLENQEQTKKTMATLQTTVSLSAKHEKAVKRKRKTSKHLRFFSPQNKSKKCKTSFKGNTYRTVFVNNPDGETSSKNVRTVELTLFGTTPKGNCNLIEKSRILSPKFESETAQRPPEVVSVNLSPLKRKSNVCIGANSHGIHEKRSFPPTKIGQRRKLKMQNNAFTSSYLVSLRKAHTTVPTNTKEPPAWIWNGSTKRCLSLKRRRSIASGLKLEDETVKTNAVIRKLPVDEDGNDNENGSHAVLPLQENNVLRFSVLPSTFNFEDGSNGTKKSTDSVSDNLVKGQNKSPNKTVPMAKDTWSEKKRCPLPMPPLPKTARLFQQFQKKYLEKTQLSTDK